jgi:hypothetical protein
LFLDPFFVPGDPRFGRGHGVEAANGGWISLRGLDLDPEGPAWQGDYSVGRFCVWMSSHLPYMGIFPVNFLPSITWPDMQQATDSVAG